MDNTNTTTENLMLVANLTLKVVYDMRVMCDATNELVVRTTCADIESGKIKGAIGNELLVHNSNKYNAKKKELDDIEIKVLEIMSRESHGKLKIKNEEGTVDAAK